DRASRRRAVDRGSLPAVLRRPSRHLPGSRRRAADRRRPCAGYRTPPRRENALSNRRIMDALERRGGAAFLGVLSRIARTRRCTAHRNGEKSRKNSMISHFAARNSCFTFLQSRDYSIRADRSTSPRRSVSDDRGLAGCAARTGAERGLSSVELLPLVALVLAGRDQGGLP